MAEVAFATYQKSPAINEDDALVADLLRQKGITVTPAVWDAPDINWSRFDCVLIRSAWDYHLKPSQYEQWLRSFLAAGSCLWNPPQSVLWNMNKKYLIDLLDRGIKVVPTTYQPLADGLELRQVLKQCTWDDVVIKPAVSACANGAWRTSLAAADVDQPKFAEQLRSEDILIQPYMPEVADKGEWSLVFFDGHYSHAVLKRPANGDFRVQREFGGKAVPAVPPLALIEQAQLAVSAVGQEVLYARVDGIEREGKFVLMELEINEPFLFIGFSAGAAQRFAEAILRKLPL